MLLEQFFNFTLFVMDLCAPLVSKEEDMEREAIRAGAYLHPKLED
jgi:hypothetical protein